MDRLEEAREALVDGLQFEPNDKVRMRVEPSLLVSLYGAPADHM